MYLLGHVGVSVFLFYVFQKLTNAENLKLTIFVGIGSMIPDVIDKPIGSIFFAKGRWFGHSIIFLTSIFLISYLLSNKTKFQEIRIRDIIKLLYIGSLAHLVEDGTGLSQKIVFWPLYGSIHSGGREDFLHGFEDTSTIFFEILGFTLLVVIGISENWNNKYWKLFSGSIILYFLVFLATYLIIVGI